MTSKEAEAILEAMLTGARDYDRPRHFWDNCAEEGYTVQDINPLLRSHTLSDAPEERPTGAYRVRLIGKCLEGRRTLLVVDLRAEGPCALVSIMEDNSTGKTKRRAR